MGLRPSPTAPTRTYTFDDICSALNEVAPADWGRFLGGWIDAHDELDTTIGLTRHGWRLAFIDTPTAAFRASEDEAGVADLSYSLGLTTRDDGMVRAVAWNGPVFRAGMRPGARIVEVNAVPFRREALLAAVRHSTNTPISLTIEQDGLRSEVPVGYAGPLRYPRLEQIAGQPDTLAILLTAR